MRNRGFARDAAGREIGAMAHPERPGRLLPALILILVGAFVADLAWRVLARAPAADGPSAVAAPADTPSAAPAPAGAPMAEPFTSALGAITPTPDEAARRAALRERLRRETGGTYLAETVEQADSAVRRWPDERLPRPLRLAVVRANVAGFREDYIANVTWAVGRWNAALLPVQLDMGSDTAGADIVLTWVAGLDGNRTGRADLTWDNRGRIGRVAIVLATHTPAGRQLDSREMVALALHEIGHALGLGHSPVQQDVLYAVTRASELTERDRKTARLLYSLPPGSLR
jgi:hypothetical protein